MKVPKLSQVLSIALTGHRLHAALLKRSGGKVQVVRATQASMALDPLNNDPELVGRELRRLLDEAGISEKRCIVSLPLRWAFVLPVDVPDLPEADRQEFLDLQAERSFPFALEDLMQASSWPQPARATIVAMPLSYLTALQAALANAGLRPISVSLGLTSLAAGEARKGREEIDLLVSSESLELAVRAGNGYAALRVLDDAMERGQDSTRFDAEVIVRQLRITLGQMPAELMSAVKTVHAYGPEALVRQLVEQVRPVIGKISLTIEAGQLADVKPAAGQESAPDVLAAGARILRGLAPEFELLPRKQSQWDAIRKRIASGRSVLIGGAVALVLLTAGGAFGWQISQLSGLQSKFTDLEKSAQPVATIQGLVNTYKAWYSDDPRAMRILLDLTKSFAASRGTRIWASTLKMKDATDKDKLGTTEVTLTVKANSTSDYFAMSDALFKMKSVVSLTPGGFHADPSHKETPTAQFTFNWKDSASNGK